jgi:hypothetical protein
MATATKTSGDEAGPPRRASRSQQPNQEGRVMPNSVTHTPTACAHFGRCDPGVADSSGTYHPRPPRAASDLSCYWPLWTRTSSPTEHRSDDVRSRPRDRRVLDRRANKCTRRERAGVAPGPRRVRRHVQAGEGVGPEVDQECVPATAPRCRAPARRVGAISSPGGMRTTAARWRGARLRVVGDVERLPDARGENQLLPELHGRVAVPELEPESALVDVSQPRCRRRPALE